MPCRSLRNVPTVVIVSSCYSGSFAAGPMLAPNRIILTRPGANRPSFGCQADRTYTVFDECLLAALPGRPDCGRGVFDASLACVRSASGRWACSPRTTTFLRRKVRDLSVP